MSEAPIQRHKRDCACSACKPTPGGLSESGGAVFRAFASLSATDRARIMDEFCECGSADLKCQCWNDE